MLNFQTRIQTEPEVSEEFAVWIEELQSRLDQEKCIVCFQALTSEHSKIVICKHCRSGGHYDHLNQWVATNKYCPLCRQQLLAKDLIVVA